MTEIFIHAGLNKSASTYLQQHVFPLIEDANFFCFHQNLGTGMLREDLSLKKMVVFSDESLLGVPIFTRSSSRPEERLNFIQNTKLLFPHAKIIICFREHASFLISLYKQYLHLGGTLRFRDFFDIKRDRGFISKKDLFFEERIRLIRDNFENAPFLFTDSDLRSDRGNVLKALLQYMGTTTELNVFDSISEKRENRGVGLVQSILLRQLNKLAVTQLSPCGLPGLNGRVMRGLGLDPRSLCQSRLSFLSDRELQLPVDVKSFLDQEYSKDWGHVLNSINYKKF
jgi:hypothetical protein